MNSTGRPRRTGLRWLAVLATAAVLGVAAVSASVSIRPPCGLCTAGRRRLTRGAATDAVSQLTVTVAPDNGGILAPGQDLTVQVSVTNGGSSSFVAGTVDLWFDTTPIDSRKSLATWLGSTDAGRARRPSVAHRSPGSNRA